jgi:predicted DCC family thiol-disulfide oxidoreductase YuxK
VVLIRKDGVRRRSDAVLDIARQLGGAWRWLAVLSVVPRPIRDGIYDLIARNRHRWFGRNPACPVPPDDIRGRFLP